MIKKYKDIYLILILCLLSLIINLLYLNYVPLFDEFGDEVDYKNLANNLFLGKGFTQDGINPEINRVPIYPLFLSLFLFITNDLSLIAKITNSIFASLIPLLIYLLGSLIMDKKNALIASFIGVFYPGFIVYNFYPSSEMIFLVFFGLLYYFFIKYLNKSNNYLIILFFVLFAISSLLREEFFFFIITLSLLLIYKLKYYKVRKKQIFTGLFVFLIITMTWGMRNYYVSGFWYMPTTVMGGPVNLWQSLYYSNCDKQKMMDYKHNIIDKLPYNYSRKLVLEQSLNLIKNQPSTYLNALIWNFKELFIGSHTVVIKPLAEVTFNQALKDKKYYFIIIKIILFSFNIIITTLGFIGIYLMRRNKIAMLLAFPFLFKVIIHFLTKGEIRYLIPVYPFLLIFSAVTINLIYTKYILHYK